MFQEGDEVADLTDPATVGVVTGTDTAGRLLVSWDMGSDTCKAVDASRLFRVRAAQAQPPRAVKAGSAVESPVDRVLQVIRANFGDRLIIRVSEDLDLDAIEGMQKALTALNPGVKFVFLTADHPVQPEPEFLERACEVLHDAYEQAATGAGWVTNPASRKPWTDVPAENQATMRAAVTALWQWMVTGG